MHVHSSRSERGERERNGGVGGTHLHSPSPHMRHEHHVRVAQQARVDLGLLLEDVQTGREDLAAVEGLDQGGLVDDGAPGRVDDDHAVLHLGEFGAADDVARVFL